MPLTPAPTWVFMMLICVCLLLGDADVNAERAKMQLKGEAHNGGPSSLVEQPSTTPQPRIMKFLLTPNYTYPIVTKGGVQYFDLAGVTDTHLTISRNTQSVEGITATHGDCKVVSLYLRRTYLLDEDLFTHCPQLHLKLKGDKWPCVKVGRMLQQRGEAVDMRLAKCVDAWDDNKNDNAQLTKYRLKEGIQKLEKFDITGCSAERCMCRWYFKGDAYTVHVDCEGVGLTDDTLPTLPSLVREVRLERNFLRSMDKLIQHLMPHNQTLQIIAADLNQMQELPRLPQGAFPLINVISLIKNRIERIDIDAFEELVAKKDFEIHLQDNPFRCDCSMYRFKDFLQQQCMDGSKLCNRKYMGLKCTYEDDNKRVPVYEVSTDVCTGLAWQQVDWWLLLNICLGVLDLFVIYLMVDLMCIVTNMGGRKERRPVMDCMLCALKSGLCFLCGGFWALPKRTRRSSSDAPSNE